MSEREEHPPIHTESGESLSGEDNDQRVVMRELLRDGHPWLREELEREVAGSEGKRGEVRVAIELLYRAGLVSLSGELVLPTRAARYMHELTEESI